MEGRPWLFRKQLIIFERLLEPTEWSKISLVKFLFWIKIGPCPPECDKKDLMHVIGLTFGGVLRAEVKGDLCRIRVQLNAQKPLRRGIFVSVGANTKLWIPFKYETLPGFGFGCGRMGYNLRECHEVSATVKELLEDDLPYSLALKTESNLGKSLCVLDNKQRKQCCSVFMWVTTWWRKGFW